MKTVLKTLHLKKKEMMQKNVPGYIKKINY